ncbi:MAG: hypothetical protein ABR566_17795 [Pyrinomonadaceae bacterium]
MPNKLNKIYGNRAVKDALMSAQHNKCCYCERSRERGELDVEHYRPKGAVKQSRVEKEIHPGYYWLAYSWDNLYLSCKGCNSGWKTVLFPLANPKKRIRSHGGNLADEKPLFVNPGIEDPRRHIRYRNDAPYPLTKKGAVTIKELGLLADNRPFLREERLEKLKVLRYYCKVVEYSQKNPGNAELAELAENARKCLAELSHPAAEFSSMAKDFITDYFKNL